MKEYRNKAIALATAVALTVSISPVYAAEQPSSAAAAQEKLFATPSLGKVKISNSAHFELLNVQEFEQTTDKIISFTLRLNNNGNQKSLNFMDYWVRVKSKGGSSHPVKFISEDKEKDVVAAGSYQDYRFYTKVNKSTKLSDLQFSFIEWDFSQPDFERELGTIRIPATYHPVVPEGNAYVVTSDRASFKTSIKRIAVGRNDKNYLPTLTVVMENSGNQAVTGLNVQFQIRSQNGLYYPLKSNVTENTIFNPLEKKEVTLSGQIPLEAGNEGWELVMIQTIPMEAGSMNIPLASFEVPKKHAEEVSVGTEQIFSTEDGTYTAVLSSLTRVPWEDDDILVANVTLKNKGTRPLPLPKISGKFELDEVVDYEADLVQLDKVLTIAPGSEIEVQFIGKIPYTYTFDKVTLVLQENLDENQTAELLEFNHSSELMSIPTVAVGEQHFIEAVGKRASVEVRKVDTYEGTTTKIINAMVDVTNLEKRYAQTGSLVAQFQLEDGSVYPAEIVKPDANIAPQGKAIIAFQASVPAHMNTDNIKLLLGEAVETSAPQPSNDPTTPVVSAYVNPVLMDLPAEVKEPKTDTREIDFYPYKVTFEKIGTEVNFMSNLVILSFDYTLERDSMVEANVEDRRLILEIEDPKSKFTLTYEFKLDDGKVEPVNGEFPKDTLQLGSHDMEVTKVDEKFMLELQSLQTFNFNVYEQVKPGHKKLLATREIRWFTVSD